MGCGPSRATEASAYGVDATERVLDEPSAGRQTRACSRGEDARPLVRVGHAKREAVTVVGGFDLAADQ